MITVDRFRGLGDTCDIFGCYPSSSPGGSMGPDPTDVTGNSSIWANALNTLGQVGVAFAPVVKNITTPYATTTVVGPYGTSTSSVPVGVAAPPMGTSLSSLGMGIPSLGISPNMLLIGALLIGAVLMSRGH